MAPLCKEYFKIEIAKLTPSLGSVPEPSSSKRIKEYSSAFSKILFILTICDENVLKDCSILCSSPISTNIVLK